MQLKNLIRISTEATAKDCHFLGETGEQYFFNCPKIKNYNPQGNGDQLHSRPFAGSTILARYLGHQGDRLSSAVPFDRER